jgi:serine/threonine protein kinase
MNQATQPLEPSKQEHNPVQAPLPVPTSQGPADTSQDYAAPLTNSFHPTVGISASEPESAHPGLQLGARLDGYLLLEQIGRGGMGIVFKAKQPNSEQIVALKMIRDGIFADPVTHHRFLQEVRAMGRLQSAKNIVPIYHVGQFLNYSFYVMPFLAGGSLSKQRKRFLNEAPKAVALMEKVARAVHQLHLNKILHRDIKPSNILLDANDDPYLSDFGLAKLLDQDQSLTRSQQLLGTPTYMAPEQTGLLPTPMSPQTDIWALGVVLYELLTGTRPFNAPDSEISTTLFWKIVNETPTQPRKLRPDLDPGLEAVILKCLEKQPADRYANAEELADELARWLRGESLRTVPNRGWYRFKRFVRHHPILLTATLLFLLGAGIGSPAVWYLRDPERPARQIRQKLTAGQSVTLIGEKAAPESSKWLLGKEAQLSRDNDRYFTVTVPTGETGLLELVREIPIQSYRLRGKIRHDTSEFLGQVGVYFGHHAKPMDFGKYDLYYQVCFNDVIAKNMLKRPQKARPLLNPVQFCPVVYAEVGKNEPDHYYFRKTAIAEFQSTSFVGGKWRDLEITVKPQQVQIRFDLRPLFTIDLQKEMRQLRKMLDDRATERPEVFGVLIPCETYFNHQGSLGIIVEGGSAAFSNFVLEPLQAEKGE